MKEYRTMWMIPRNIRRIDPWKLVQTAKIVDAATGDLAEQKVQDALYAALSRANVKSAANANGVGNSGGFRTYLAQLSCLGLFWRDPTSGQFYTTRAGELLINGEAPGSIVRCQVLRMQYPSVYGLGNQVRISPKMKVKPFVFLVRLLEDQRLGGYLGSNDLAIPVIYARCMADYELCVRKILELRSGKALRDLIDSVDDLRTPKRCHEDDEEQDWEKGLEDAVQIGNTARNYLIASQLAVLSPTVDRAIELTDNPAILNEIKPWMSEGDKIEPLDDTHQAAWQQRYGRYDRTKAVRRIDSMKRADGLTACVQACFIQGNTDNPFGFNIEEFIKKEAARWGRSEADISLMVAPIRPFVSNIERDVIYQAAVSGGKEALVLEKAVAAIMVRLGFDQAEHIGQKKAPRKGGYPDIRIKASAMSTCGFADTKATARYGMGIGDTIKLQTYYKECWSEFDDESPSEYFIYIAGGFDKSVDTVCRNLKQCSEMYGRPVSAMTVDALVRLAQLENKPSPEQLTVAFKSGKYFASAESVISEANSSCP